MTIDSDKPTSFEVLAHGEMDPIMAAHGFECASSDMACVRYESASVFFEIGHAGYDGEVYARVGRLGAPGVLPDQTSERIDFGLFLAVMDPAGYLRCHRDVPYSCAREFVKMRAILARFARGLRDHGSPLLEGDRETYCRARELRFWHAPQLPPDHTSAADFQVPSMSHTHEQGLLGL